MEPLAGENASIKQYKLDGGEAVDHSRTMVKSREKTVLTTTGTDLLVIPIFLKIILLISSCPFGGLKMTLANL